MVLGQQMEEVRVVLFGIRSTPMKTVMLWMAGDKVIEEALVKMYIQDWNHNLPEEAVEVQEDTTADSIPVLVKILQIFNPVLGAVVLITLKRFLVGT